MDDAVPQQWSAGRVAEVIVDLPGGGSRRGSGYRVTGGRVLTAAHVVAGAAAVQVRFDAGQPTAWAVPATPVWSDPGGDLLVLGFEPPAGAPEVAPAPVGRVGAHRAVIDVSTAGYPRWKLRTTGGQVFRDLAYATGTVAVLANRRSGTLEVTVAAPDRDPQPDTSPWEAMSGAALWAGDLLIGVIAEHHRREGLGRLTAVRLDHLLAADADRAPQAAAGHAPQTAAGHAAQAADASPASLATADDATQAADADHAPQATATAADRTAQTAGPGHAARADAGHGPQAADRGRASLAALLEIPGGTALPDVVPAPAGQLARTGYREVVRDIAPAGGTLERGAELDELARFCAGGEPYLWWRAGPWAGKSALMAAFVLEPPAGVEVVSFFITARLATQSDSGAFTDALLEQLAAIAGEQVPATLTPTGRDAHRRALLHAALRRTREAGRRLVLVVDGLDEDTGARPGSGLASIASLLPRAPDEGLRIVVASRPDPPVPADVPADHPLRHCRVRELAVSPYATQVATAANRELAELLAGDQPHQEVIGLIAGSGGGLSLPELEALSGLPRFRLDALLGGVFGRTVAGRDEPGDLRPQRVYLFSHETLRAEAVAHLGAALDGYRQRIRAWAEDYRRRGWPEDTPAFLLRGYPRLLRALPDPAALVALATDPARRDLLRALSGGDATAFAELRMAQDAVLAADPPDLLAMARLAAARDAVTSRNAAVPAALPAMWATLGQPDRAEALALSLSAGHDRVSALNGLLRALAGAGDLDRAERIATEHVDPREQPAELSRLSQAAARAGDLRRATALLDRAEAQVSAGPGGRAPWTRNALAAAAAQIGDLDRAERIATAITDPDERALALRYLAELCPATDADRFERLVQAVDDPPWQRRMRVGQAEMARIALTTDPATGRVSLTGPLVTAEDFDRAEHLADSDDVSPYDWARMVTELSTAMVAAGERDRAASLMDRAERYAAALPDPWARASVWPELVRAANAAGDPDRVAALTDRAELIAATDTEPSTRARLLQGLAAASGAGERAGGLFDLAARSAAAIEPVRSRVDASAELIRSMIAGGETQAAAVVSDAAERVAAALEDVNDQAECLIQLMETAVAVGDHDRAERVVAAITYVPRRDQVVADLAAALAAAGDHDRARRVAAATADPRGRATALLAVAGVALAAGDRDRAATLTRRAEQAATGLDTPKPSPWELAALVPGYVAAGHLDRAERLAADLAGAADSSHQTSALSPLIAAVAGPDPDRVERIVARAGNPYSRAELSVRATKALAAAGHHERARRFAAAVEAPAQRLQALTALVELDAEGRARSTDLAEGTAAEIEEPYARGVLLIDLIWAVAGAGDLDRAVRIADGLPDPGQRTGLLAALWQAAAEAGEHASAARIEALLDEPSAWPALARAAARAGDRDRAAVLLDRAAAALDPDEEPAWRIWTLVVLIEAAAAGLPERGAALTDLAERDLAAADPSELADVLPQLVAAVSAGGDSARAERIATGHSGLYVNPDALLFEVAVAAGDLARATRLATAGTEPVQQADRLTALVERAMADGDEERAERTALAVTDPAGRVRALQPLIRAAVEAHDHDRAAALLEPAERAAGQVSDANRQAETWVALARVAPRPYAGRYIAQAFAGGHISIALGALADVAPDVLVRYADERLTQADAPAGS